jgi:uncharacterized protein YndB with AHSA1/START domain
MSDGPKTPGDECRQPDDEYGEVREPRTFRIERLLPGPIERVWSYLTESEKRRRWFGAGQVVPVILHNTASDGSGGVITSRDDLRGNRIEFPT